MADEASKLDEAIAALKDAASKIDVARASSDVTRRAVSGVKPWPDAWSDSHLEKFYKAATTGETAAPAAGSTAPGSPTAAPTPPGSTPPIASTATAASSATNSILQSILSNLVAINNKTPGGSAAPSTSKGPWTNSRKGRMAKLRKLAMGTRLGRMFKRTKSAGRVAGGLIGGASGAARGASVGAVAGGVVAGAAALKMFRDAVANATEATLSHARKLAEVSGSMAAVQTERDVRQTLRDLKEGEATAGTAGGLARSEAKRKDAEADIRAGFTNLENVILTVANEVILPPLEVLAALGRGVTALIKLIPGVGDNDLDKTGIPGQIPQLRKDVEEAERKSRDLMDIIRRNDRRLPGGPIQPRQ